MMLTDRELFDTMLKTLELSLRGARHAERSLRISAQLVADGADTELEWEENVGIFKQMQRNLGAAMAHLRQLGRKLGMTYEQVDQIVAGVEVRVYTEYDADAETEKLLGEEDD